MRLRYADITTPHVRFRQETVVAIDPEARRVTTDLDSYEADVLVLALGADYDVAATPGLAEAGNEFYSVAGAETLRDVLPTFRSGTAIVGVCGTPFKCPPAPSEAALLLDTFMRERGLRDDVHIRLVMPFGTPIPPSPDTSAAILSTFAERGIEFVPERTVISLDPATHEAVLDDGTRHSYDLFLGIPVHRAPAVVEAPDRRRVDRGRPAHARDAVPGRLRRGRRDERRHPEGGRVRRARRPRAGRPVGRRDAW